MQCYKVEVILLKHHNFASLGALEPKWRATIYATSFETLGLMYSKRHLPGIEQWLQRHLEAGSSWPSWPKASYLRYIKRGVKVAQRRHAPPKDPSRATPGALCMIVLGGGAFSYERGIPEEPWAQAYF